MSNTVIAIASVAPAYSLASAPGFVVLAVGLQSPIVMLLAFFRRLRAAQQDHATTAAAPSPSMVLSSAAASTLTTILPTARTTLAMAAHRSIPSRFARIHERYLTPTWSTVGMAGASIGFYVLVTVVSQNVLGDTISALGFMIAFYYGVTGYACVWWFRHDLRKGGKDLLLKGIVPFVGAVILTFFFIKGINNFWDYTYGSTYWTLPFSPHWKIGGVFLTGVGALVVGVLLMFVYRFINPPFFKGETLNRDGLARREPCASGFRQR